ncbi:MAG: flagellar protein FlaG [Sporolactobacillus sp.]|jgi:flagellar protein FlaG|nr:flagellar protein FlaG [Sporolactobacillus sp.]
MDEVANAVAGQALYLQQGQDAARIDQATDAGTSASSEDGRVYKSFNKEQLEELVTEANKTLKPSQTNLHYVLYDKLHQYYVRIEDSVTHEVLREIPPKKMMDMYAAIAEKLGLIVNKRI